MTVRLKKPVISFTFDHFTRSAVRNAAPVLEAVKARATYYASAAFSGRSTQFGAMFEPTDLLRVTEAGHEVGCCTYSHLDGSRTRLDDVFANMVRNADVLAEMGLTERLTSFAYPMGSVSNALAQALPTRFTSARGKTPGVAAGKIDLARLPANPLYGEDAYKRALRLMTQTRRRSGWLIFFCNDVSPRPSAWGTSTGVFERVVAAAYMNGFEIAPMREAAELIIAAADD